MTTDNEEEWRPIVGFPGYDVSSHGRVRSWRHHEALATGLPKVLRNQVTRQGYQSVNIRRAGKIVSLRIHRAVLGAFVGPPAEGQTDGCHNDGNPANNHPGNLRWDTPSGNHADKGRHGTLLRGERSTSPLRDADVLEIAALARAANLSQPAIAAMFGVTQGTVANINVGRTWGWLTGRENEGVGERGGRRARPAKARV